MARSALTGAVLVTVVVTGWLGGVSPLSARQGERLAERQGCPYVAQNDTRRRSAIDGRPTHHTGYVASQRTRKRIEEIFGWGKEIGPIQKTKLRARTELAFSCC